MAVSGSMDFFEHQAQARRKTGLLVGYYVAAVILILAGVYLAFAGTFLVAKHKPGTGYGLAGMWDPGLLGWVTAGTLLVVLCGSLFKISQLSGGGKSVAALLGGRPVNPNTTDPDERRVLNVVEEMAVASGTPVPPVYLLAGENGINAFAAGFSPRDAVIGVTRGCVRQLTRDQLQGVIAHEFSHILNGDMRLNIRLVGILHGILVIALLGYGIMRGGAFTSGGSRSREKGGGAIMILGLVLMLIGYVGVFFGKLIKSAVSRQREFLADASAVQFTRNPDGIAGALKKIGGYSHGSRISSPHAEETSHFFFSTGLRTSLAGLLATHPPLAERIRRIDPSFAAESLSRPSPPPLPTAAAAGLAGSSFDPAGVIAQVGAPQQEHIGYAARLLAGIPAMVRDAAHEPFGARAVVYGLLLNEDRAAREAQLGFLAQSADRAVYGETLRLLPEIARLGRETRLPLADIAVPSLKDLSTEQYARFRDNVNRLAAADKQIDIFEYALQRMITRRLDPTFGNLQPGAVKHHGLKTVLRESAQALSCLAYWGADDRQAAQEAFRAGATALGEAGLRMLPAEECGLAVLDRALAELACVAPRHKRRVLEMCVACIAHDRRVTVEEGEVLRAVADALDCPIPPFLPGQAV